MKRLVLILLCLCCLACADDEAKGTIQKIDGGMRIVGEEDLTAEFLAKVRKDPVFKIEALKIERGILQSMTLVLRRNGKKVKIERKDLCYWITVGDYVVSWEFCCTIEAWKFLEILK
ncbi:MAG: hypothetical protein J6Y62_04505 [Clostridia bacterium]|nr:hypothetical protein [Clostridia bacterium]